MINKVKALILTYDKQVGLAQLLVKKYVELGCAGRLEFIVPINNETSKFSVDGATITFVISESDILSTMQALLSVVNDEDWVFWAIDDRYPVRIKKYEFNQVIDLVLNDKSPDINGYKILPWREPLEGVVQSYDSLIFTLQKPSSMFGFWHHHFLRAKVLRSMFIDENKGQLNNIRLINNLYRNVDYLSFLEGIWVSNEPLIELAEPLFNGKLTKNGLADLQKNDCIIPEYKVIEDSLAFYNCEEQLVLSPKKPKFVSEDYFEK